MSETSGYGLVASYHLAIRLGLIRCGRDAFHTKDDTYVSKESGNKLAAVVDQNRIQNTVGKDLVVQKRGSNEWTVVPFIGIGRVSF